MVRANRNFIRAAIRPSFCVVYIVSLIVRCKSVGYYVLLLSAVFLRVAVSLYSVGIHCCDVRMDGSFLPSFMAIVICVTPLCHVYIADSTAIVIGKLACCAFFSGRQHSLLCRALY